MYMYVVVMLARCTATHCNTLQHSATHCNTLQHTVTHGNMLLHTATHCTTLQHTVTHLAEVVFISFEQGALSSLYTLVLMRVHRAFLRVYKAPLNVLNTQEWGSCEGTQGVFGHI